MPAEYPANNHNIRSRALVAGLVEGRVTILHQNPDGRYDFVENLPTTWSEAEILERNSNEVFPPALAMLLDEARTAAGQSGHAHTVDFQLPDKNSTRCYEARIRADLDEQGAYAGTLTIIIDVTEQRNRELALSALMREVSHRSKNMLAIVQSVAMQTARHSVSTEEFLARFRGRLHALSSTQDLVTESNWRGTYFRSLVTAQLARVGPAATSQSTIEGDNPLLGPNASLHVGLAIHELATNAVLHGALADSDIGKITVSAHQHADGSGLTIEWHETPKPESQGPQRFGMKVLERIVPLSVGGTAHYETSETGIRYRLDIPPGHFET